MQSGQWMLRRIMTSPFSLKVLEGKRRNEPTNHARPRLRSLALLTSTATLLSLQHDNTPGPLVALHRRVLSSDCTGAVFVQAPATVYQSSGASTRGERADQKTRFS